MNKFVIILDRAVNLYIFFVVLTCLISWVPNINPNYPLFYFLFKYSGFFLIPSIGGFVFGPMAVLIVLTLVSMGLRKIYAKFLAKNEPQVFILTKDEFIKAMELHKKNNEKEKDKKDDSN